jgi:predicted nuclease of predicted toxin-antitoxin system
VRILLDECVPARLARELAGHEVTTVRRMQWASLSDRQLLDRASSEFDVLLTGDRSMEFQQALPQTLALITVVSRSIEFQALTAFLPEIRSALDTIHPGDQSAY